MANVDLSITAGDGKTRNRKVFRANGTCLLPGPFVYVDSASPLGALSLIPLSGAVSVGQKYLLQDYFGTPNRNVYAEITQAGTTSTSYTQNQVMGNELTNGTAKFKIRYFHGWSRARWQLDYYSLGNLGVIGTTIQDVVALVASSHTQSYGGTTLALQPYVSFTYDNLPGFAVVSVNKTPAVTTTFTAGAQFWSTGNADCLRFSSSHYLGTVRGLNMGHDNTTSSQYYDDFGSVYGWSVEPRYVDCTFTTYRQNNYGTSGTPVDAEAGHTGARHSLRCTYASLNATTAAPNLSQWKDTFVEAPTLSRSAHTTPLVRGIDRGTGGVANWAGGNMLVLAANWASFTAGPAYEPQSLQSQTPTMDLPSAFRAFGSSFKASGITSPASFAVDTTRVYQGTSLVTESRAGGDVQLVRNATYVRSGGASDVFGSFSYQAAAKAELQYLYEFDFWNTKIDESFLITLEFEWSSTGTGITALTNEDIWLEAMYYNSPTTEEMELVFSFDKEERNGLIYNHAVGPPALSTSAASWSGALGSAVKQKVSVIVTPKKAGPIRCLLGAWLCPWTQDKASVSSITIYFDPLPDLGVAP